MSFTSGLIGKESELFLKSKGDEGDDNRLVVSLEVIKVNHVAAQLVVFSG